MQDRKHQNCLLVVDDEDDFRFLFSRHFRKKGYEVLEALDGVAALEVFDRRGADIDLVISDIRMPRLDGRQLIPELRRRRQHLPILGITGQDDLKSTLSLLDNGAYYYIEKPVDHWALVERLVENAIRLHHREAEIEHKRKMENDIARLLREYILQFPAGGRYISGPPEGLRLEIACEPVEIAQPSGDWAEWFLRDGDEVVFYVADASGHNNLVASFIACLANMVLHRSHHGRRPAMDELVREIDGALDKLRRAEALDTSRYLTFFIGCINLVTGELAYVNAGHPDALLRRDGDAPPSVLRLATTCRPVGLISLFQFPVEVGRVKLAPGDLLLIYTDGAADVFAEGDPRLGMAGLEKELLTAEGDSAVGVVEQLVGVLREKTGGIFEDDTTLMAVRVERLAEEP